MEAVFVKLQAFTINESDGLSDGACFYFHAVVVSFYKASARYTLLCCFGKYIKACARYF